MTDCAELRPAGTDHREPGDKDATAEALGGTPDDVFADTAIRTYRLELM